MLSKDFLSGLMFLTFAAAGLYLGRNLHVGTAGEMGSGYFPLLLSRGIGLIGLILVVRSLLNHRSHRVHLGSLRPLVFIVAAIVLFGLLAEALGFVVTLLLVIPLIGLASSDSRWREVAVTTVLLIVFVVLAFKIGLGLPIPIWPA